MKRENVEVMAKDTTITRLMNAKDVSQVELAEMLGTTKQNINNKINRNNFSALDMVKIAEALNMRLAFVPNEFEIGQKESYTIADIGGFIVEYSEEERNEKIRKSSDKTEEERKLIARKSAETRKQNKN